MPEYPIPTGSWTFWYMNKPATKGHIAPTNYESHIHKLLTVDSLPAFCSAMSHICLPSIGASKIPNSSEESDTMSTSSNVSDEESSKFLPSNIDLHFFKSGIKPTWEDPANMGGGRFFIRLRKGISSRFFEWFLLALISPDNTEWVGSICGAVLSSRYMEDLLAVWCVKGASESEFVAGAIRERLRQVLQLPPAHPIEYKPHEESIRK